MTSKFKIRPLADRVVVEPLEAEEKSKGGIILPDTAKEKPQEGKVVAVGKGRVNDKGEVIPIQDKVLYGKYSGTEVTVDEKQYIILREDDILAVIEEK